MKITQEQAEKLASLVYPGEAYSGPCSDGPDCKVCKSLAEEWQERVAVVRAAAELTLSE